MSESMVCPLRELKFAPSESSEMKFTGFGAVFGNVDSHGDVIDRGAFKNYLDRVKSGETEWPAMLLQHGGAGLTAQDLTPIGVWTDLSEGKDGLIAEGVLADTPRGHEIYKLMKMSPRPAINGLSIGYVARDWEMRSTKDGQRRALKAIDLHEISPVTFPSNKKAMVTHVKTIEQLTTLADVTDYLRAFGMSKSQATALIARTKGIGLGNPVDASRGGPENLVVAQLAALLKRNSMYLK